MKKFSVAIGLFLVFASALATTREEAKAKVDEAANACNAHDETKVTKDEIQKWLQEGGTKPANLGAHSLCLCKKLGMQDEDGTIKRESMKQHMLDGGIPEEKVTHLLDECAVEKPTKEETAEHMLRCFLKAMKKKYDHDHDHSQGH